MGKQLLELKRALQSTGDGEALMLNDFDLVLHEELLDQQPLLELVEVEPADGKVHEYRVRSSHPRAWFEGEAASPNFKNSAYARKSVSLKIQRIWGSVTGFARTMSQKFVDALVAELQGSVYGMSDILEYGLLWGCADDIGFTGDAYQYTGIVPRLIADAMENVIDGGGVKITLDHLDQALAKATAYRGVQRDPKSWFMGVRMKQVVDGLQTKVQIPLTDTELRDGAIRMRNYADIPIFETPFVSPAASSSSPSDLAGSSAAGSGSLAEAAVYAYRIASITLHGEQVAAAASADVTVGVGHNTINLTWSADPNAYMYMIFRQTGGSGGSNDFKLLDIIPALAYDSDGNVTGTVTTYSDTGAKSEIAVKPLESGEQNIVLANFDRNRGMTLLGKVDESGQPIDTLFTFEELGKTKDSYDYFLKGYLAAKIVHPNLFAMVRHVKLA